MVFHPPTLPQELIDHVIGLLAESGVAQLENVSLASRALLVSCQPHQFKRLNIPMTYPPGLTEITRRKISVFRRNPALLQHARILTINVYGSFCDESMDISGKVDNVSDLLFVLDNLSKVQKANLTCNNASLDQEASPTVAASFFRFLSSNPLQHLTLRKAHVPSNFLNWLPPTLVSLSTFNCRIASHGTKLDPPLTGTSGTLQSMTRLRFDELPGTFNLALLKQASSLAPAIQSVHISLNPSTVKALFIDIDLTQGDWDNPRKEYRDVFVPSFQLGPHPHITRFDLALTVLDLRGKIPQLTKMAFHYLVSTRLLIALNTVTLRYYFTIPESRSESGIVDGGFLGARGIDAAVFPRKIYIAKLDNHLADRKAMPGLREMNVVASFLKYDYGLSTRTIFPEKVTIDPPTHAKLTLEIEAAFCRTRERFQGEGMGKFNVYLTTGVWRHMTQRATLDMAPDTGPEYPLGAIEDYGLQA